MRLLTIPEVAERLAVTTRQVNVLINRGDLPYVCVSTSKQSKKPRKRVAECDVNAFIEARRVAQPRIQPRRRGRYAVK